jgi:hypothetical protein
MNQPKQTETTDKIVKIIKETQDLRFVNRSKAQKKRKVELCPSIKGITYDGKIWILLSEVNNEINKVKETQAKAFQKEKEEIREWLDNSDIAMTQCEKSILIKEFDKKFLQGGKEK